MDRIHGPVPPTGLATTASQDQGLNILTSRPSSPARGIRAYDAEELKSIREKFEWTKSLPDSLINRLEYTDLVKFGNKPNKQDLTKQGLKDLLASNSNSLLTPQHTGNHLDDSAHVLCPVRLDRYPRTSVPEFMSTAKSILPSGGIKPTKDYDLEFFGLQGTVTDRGWFEVHNPGSELLNLKMFSRANSGVASDSSRASFALLASGEGIGVTESLIEIGSMIDFKEAIRSYFTASYLALPWYPAPLALINFFEHHQYFKNLIPEKEQASVLTKFTNETMLKNAKAWQSRSSPPLSAENLLVSWHFFLARNTSLNSSIFSPHTPLRTSMNPYEKQNSQSLALSGKQNYTIPRITSPKSAQDAAYKKAVNNNVCYRYNLGRCPNQADQSCKQTNSKDGSLPRILKHICNICGRKHPARDHPKN
jgi:hypothetical protein